MEPGWKLMDGESHYWLNINLGNYLVGLNTAWAGCEACNLVRNVRYVLPDIPNKSDQISNLNIV